MDMIEHAITPRLLAALVDTPAVMLVGPRQAARAPLYRVSRMGPIRPTTSRQLPTSGRILCIAADAIYALSGMNVTVGATL